MRPVRPVRPRLRRSLSHPNVLRIHAAFLHRQRLVIASEFCDAGDLQALGDSNRAASSRSEVVAKSPGPDSAAGAPGVSVLIYSMIKALSLHTVELQLASWKQQCRAVTHRSSGIYNINPTLTW